MAIPYRKFFKIMQNHELENGELRVPKKFVKMYWKLGIPNPIFLKLPNGRAEWKIFWVERDGDIWFQKSWEKFARLLKYGYNLNFEYLGGPNFKVEIFDCTSLEIDYSNIINCGDDVDEVSDECVEILDESKIQALKRKKSKRKNNIDFDAQQKFSAEVNRGSKAKKRSKIEAVKDRAWNSHPDENPNFEIKLSRSYVHANLLILPRKFGKKPWIGLEGTASISVGEAIWKVNFKFSNINSRYFMTSGWKSFTQENNLQVGDVCKFEMTQSKPVVIFRITINRASRDEPCPEQLQDYESPNMKGNTFKVSVKSSDQLQLGRPVCRSEVKLSTLLKKDGNYVNGEGKTMADKISESLSEDQERVIATVGVPSKINAYPDDAIGKVYGAEHSGWVRVLDPGVCPTNVFGMHRHFTDFIQVCSSSQMNVEDLKKHVENLEEKLIGYEETTEQVTQTTEQLAQPQHQNLQNFIQHKFGDELSTFNLGVPPS